MMHKDKPNIHNFLSFNILYFLDNIYYKNLKKIYNADMKDIFQYEKITILKPEYFIYLKFYTIYLFLYYDNPLIYILFQMEDYSF